MSDLVGNPEDGFSKNEAQILWGMNPTLSPKFTILFHLHDYIIFYKNIHGKNIS